MIKEVIIVEGKRDIAAVQRAVEADCLATEGFNLSPACLQQIEIAYRRNGIIILTDPDTAGERIRKVLAKRFPLAKHAFVTQKEATANGDIGVEQADVQAVRAALAKARYHERQPRQEFTQRDVHLAGASGQIDAAKRRAALGGLLGIGNANAKTFLHRLNNYGVTREEFLTALASLEANDV